MRKRLARQKQVLEVLCAIDTRCLLRTVDVQTAARRIVRCARGKRSPDERSPFTESRLQEWFRHRLVRHFVGMARSATSAPHPWLDELGSPVRSRREGSKPIRRAK